MYNFSVVVNKVIDMENNIDKKYCIDSQIIKNYIDVINSTTQTISQINEQINTVETMNIAHHLTSTFDNNEKNLTFKQLTYILDMTKALKFLIEKYPKELSKIYFSIIRQMMRYNNGLISTRMLEPLHISRQYLSILKKNNEIEQVSRGIYMSPTKFEDSYYIFQMKYKKAVFSHMNALYFYEMTEEFPYTYTVTVPQNYHADGVNEKCDVFYVSDDIYELGLYKTKTPDGNEVKAYDLERSICDIIRSKNRMDFEQVKKAVKEYAKSRDKDLKKLSEYSKKMGINEQVMEMVGMYND